MTLIALVAMATTAQAQVRIDEENFPDAFFRKFVADAYDTDKNGMLSASEIEAVTKVELNNSAVEMVGNLKGIEHFTALTALMCGINELTELDLSRNTALQELRCYENQLTRLDLSHNTALTLLECSNNQLEELDLSKNTALEQLYCENNKLTKLNLSQNAALTILMCSDNQLEELDLSQTTALVTLYCENNKLTRLDLSQNNSLSVANCSSNSLTELKVSAQAPLNEITCYYNNIDASAMMWFVGSLPQTTDGVLNVVDLSESLENNVITRAQVKKAKDKGWVACNNGGGSRPIELYYGKTADTYILTLASATNGAYAAAPNGTVEEGAEVVLVDIPESGYVLKEYKAYKTGDASIAVAVVKSEGKSVFCMPSYDVTVQAEFEKKEGGATGLFDAKLDALSVSPNPTQGAVQVEATGTVLVSNVAGQLLQRVASQGQVLIDLSGYPDGIYFISVGNAVAKVVKR